MTAHKNETDKGKAQNGSKGNVAAKPSVIPALTPAEIITDEQEQPHGEAPALTYEAPTRKDLTKHGQDVRKGVDSDYSPGSIDKEYRFKKTRKVTVSVTKDGDTKQVEKILKGEESFVHVLITDYGSPRSKKNREETVFHKIVQKFSPHDFVKLFGSNFTKDGAFENVVTPFTIYQICKNITKANLKERYEDVLFEKTRGKGKAKRDEYLQYLFETKTELRMMGTHMVVTASDFLHIPVATDENPYGYDEKYAHLIPSNV